MTLPELKAMDRAVITPAIAADLLECDPNWIRQAARKRPDLLPFPVMVVKSRVKIPRLAFIKFMEGGNQDEA